LKRRIEKKPSRTAEWTCICCAASFLEKDPHYKSDDSIALRILPPPIGTLIRNPLYRALHTRVGAPKGVYEYMIARTKYMDAVYQMAIREKFAQVALIGAGYDSRAIRFPSDDLLTTIYELDSKNTQQAKLNLHDRSGIRMPQNLSFEGIDLAKDTLSRGLGSVGFQKGTRCLFIMEGVSMYLDLGSASEVFQTVSDSMGPRSLFAFDYVSSDALRHEKTYYG
jgi:methyltransferase (TIGR00027 family)